MAGRGTCHLPSSCYNSPLNFGVKDDMAKRMNTRGGGNDRESRGDKAEKFQSFSRPKLKITRTSASGKGYIDYKDTESLKKVMSSNGKILARKRTGANAMEQRMLARAVRRARYMALVPYVSTGQ
jgi:small subunit ribosomal protein S18